MSRYKQVFDALKGELDKVTTAFSTATIETILRDVFDVQSKISFPWIGLFPDSAVLTTGSMAGESGKKVGARFVILVYVRDEVPTDRMLAILAEIKKQVEDDPRLGITAFSVYAHADEVNFGNTTEITDASGSKRIGQMEIIVTVDFRHPRENP